MPAIAEDRVDRIERWAEQLLLRWGVIMRDLLARETAAPPWRELLPLLRRMEARGQIEVLDSDRITSLPRNMRRQVKGEATLAERLWVRRL